MYGEHVKWASAVSRADDLDVALAELQPQLSDALDGARPHLLLAFASHHHRPAYGGLGKRLAHHLDPGLLLGCSAAGVIGDGEEVEDGVALSLTAAILPDVELHPFHVEHDSLPSPDASPAAWIEALGVPARASAFVLLGDPREDPGRLLEGLDFAYTNSQVIGGLASDPQRNALFLGDRVLDSGMIGVGLSGNVVLEPVVAQGCRPIGSPAVVTKCHQNLLLELDNQRPTDVLGSIYQDLDARGRSLVERALHLGVAASGLVSEDTSPDYLIRNVIGADPGRGFLAIGSLLRTGQTVQFHLRDAQAAGEDLRARLDCFMEQERPTPPSGAVLFSCTGRGAYLYGSPNHDSDLFGDRLGALPLGGFFCAGEIGKVGVDTRLLGYTSSFGVFRPRGE